MEWDHIDLFMDFILFQGIIISHWDKMERFYGFSLKKRSEAGNLKLWISFMRHFRIEMKM